MSTIPLVCALRIQGAAGRHEQVAVARGASESIEPVAGGVRWDLRRLVEEAIERARSVLGTVVFDQTAARGRSMTVEDVVDFVASGD